MSEIADMVKRDRKTIAYWLKKLGIESRGNSNPSRKTREQIAKAMKGNTRRWGGGVIICDSGYRHIMRKDHPYADSKGYVREHRLVMEDHIGRFLLPSEVVHHRDSNRTNNDIGNLFLFPSHTEHRSFHIYKENVDPSITEEEFMEEIYKNEGN